MINKKIFVKTIKYTAVQFNKNAHPYHHSVQRQTTDGKIPDYEKYFCIIPTGGIEYIEDGDWIVVDDMNNAKGVFSRYHFEHCGITEDRASEQHITNGSTVTPVSQASPKLPEQNNNGVR